MTQKNKMNSKITILLLILTNIIISSILILIPKDHVELILVGFGGIILATISSAFVVFGVVLLELSMFFLNFLFTYFFLKLVMRIMFKINFLEREDLTKGSIVLASIVISLINQTSIFQQSYDLINLVEKIQHLG